MADKKFTDEIESDDERRQLIALRDFVAHELEGNRCNTCMMSKLRTGDTAALVLRLQKIIEDIRALPPENAEGKVTRLESIRGRRGPSGAPEAEGSRVAQLGYKSSPRRQGGRTPSGTRQPGA